MVRRGSLFAGVSLLALGHVGCADDGGDPTGPEPGSGPTLVSISTDEISVGQPLELVGEGFVAADEVYTQLRFRGTYQADAGASEAVALAIRPHRVADERLLWSSFGPFRIPFSSVGVQLGVYRGDVTAVNVTADGDEASGVPLSLT